MEVDTGTGDPEMGVDQETFRQALSRLAGGIVVVTASNAAGEPAGATATAVCSVSLDPPLVLVCLAGESSTRQVIADSGRYAINVLGHEHASRSRRFAGTGDGKFAGEEWTSGRLGCPLLPGSIAVCECQVEQTIEAGDHSVLIGRVIEAAAVESDSDLPLIWFRGRYARLSAEDVE